MSRVRPHFKAHTSISHHHLMSEIYPSNDLLSLWLRLGLVAIDRYAAKAFDKVRIHRNELCQLAGGKRRDKAEDMLKLLASKLQLTLKKDGDYFELEWRNLSKKQGFGSNNVPRTANSDTNADTNADTNTNSTRWLLDEEFVEKLRSIRPGGILYSAAEVQDWFLQKKPQMEIRGIKDFRRAAANWWERASRTEVSSASRWAQVQRLEDVAEQISNSEEEDSDSLEDFGRMFGSGDEG